MDAYPDVTTPNYDFLAEGEATAGDVLTTIEVPHGPHASLSEAHDSMYSNMDFSAVVAFEKIRLELNVSATCSLLFFFF
jgi:hypothetical protein